MKITNQNGASDPTGSASNNPVLQPKTSISEFWKFPALIQPNNFKYKSLSCWSFNTTVGCTHGCRFCYVPATTANKQADKLQALGVDDPDEQWGKYVFVREWDEDKFLKSLIKAEKTPVQELNADGNRAAMYCTTTDPYQVIRHPVPKMQQTLMESHQELVRRSLELIRDQSSLNVRILTRSPLARSDFELMASFGKRLMFGMSIPTLRHDLAKVYEPHAPAPLRRLETLKAAKAAGLNIYVAMAPTYPECNEADLRQTLEAIAPLEPLTIYHEPINIRAENVERIKMQAEATGVALKTEVFDTPESWRAYAIESLLTVEKLANELGLGDRLHLWPDSSLGSKKALATMENSIHFSAWLNRCWSRISEWPR
jgi:DNA repair photolyase